MMEWLIAHRKSITNCGFGALALLMAFYALYGRTRAPGEADYIAAEQYYRSWIAKKEHDAELFKKLEASLKRHPELHAQYDALIAERLLAWNESAAALGYLQPSLQRVGSELPFYPEFAQATLLIAREELKEALSMASQLKEAMDEDATLFVEEQPARWEGFLYAFNLVRIGMLERRVGSPEGERAAWQELAALRQKDHEAFDMLHHHFRAEGLSLFDYIRHRERQLVASAAS